MYKVCREVYCVFRPLKPVVSYFVQVALLTVTAVVMGRAAKAFFYKVCKCTDGYQGTMCEIKPSKYNIMVIVNTYCNLHNLYSFNSEVAFVCNHQSDVM